MNNLDEDIYAKREKNITVEGSKVSPLGGDLEGAFHLTRPSSLPLRLREILFVVRSFIP